jgi:radical SAM superfamily enzyme YgiQ (UPF0313 family)
MSKSLYLVNPRARIPGYYGADVFERSGLRPAQGIADLATTTVAALAPADWRLSICDEHISPIDFESDAAFVGITGKITQAQRMLEVADQFRGRGKCVIVGGPYASLSPEVFRGRCDILVVGELEGIARDFFADLERGTWKEEYTAEKPDLANSPIPRWDLYPTDRALVGCVQTSRGCPFECEFCDVIQYLGRKQRHKPLHQVLAELDVLYDHGFRGIFLADDNFTVYRRRAKELLTGLREWNRARPGRTVTFSTQVSIDAARDSELVEMCGQAGITGVFIGIETPNQDSLRETKKRQNVAIDLLQQVHVFLNNGIGVTGGMMVGFDHDDRDIFERQYEFAMASPIPIFTLGALVAPAATPLFARMKREGRLIEGATEVAGCPWDTNIVPARMKQDELLKGLRWLWRQLYHPDNFARRVLQMIDSLRPVRGPHAADLNLFGVPRPIEAEALLAIQKLREFGSSERRMITAILRAMRDKPESRRHVTDALYRYAQARCIDESGYFFELPPAVGSPFVQLTGA